VKRIRPKIGSSLHLGWQDAWQTTGKRMPFPIAILGTTVVLAITLASRQPVALLSFLAYPVALIAVCVFFVGCRLFVSRRQMGWSRLWTRHPQVVPDGTRIDAQIRSKCPPMHTPLPFPCELSCLVRDPAGRETRILDVQLMAGQGWAYFSYPGPGSAQAPLAPGDYWISWQWRKPEKSPRWHAYDVHRVTVHAPAASLPPAGASTASASSAGTP
jgi:hypothetical protein